MRVIKCLPLMYDPVQLRVHYHTGDVMNQIKAIVVAVAVCGLIAEA